MPSPSLAIILLNWNSTGETLQCLRHLARADYPRNRLRIILLDNGSRTNEAARLQQELGPAAGDLTVDLLVSPVNLGFAGGVNRSLEHLRAAGPGKPGNGTADYILLLNNDTEPSSNLLARLTEVTERHPDAWVLGAVMESPSGVAPVGVGRIHWWSGLTSFSKEIPPPDPDFVECDLVHGCCFLIRWEAIARLGGLDDDYFAYYEESDFCVRVRRAGGKVGLVPSARILHTGSVSVDRVSGMREYFMMRNRIVFVRKNGSRLQWLSTVLHALLGYGPKRTARAIVYGSWSAIPWLWRGWISGVLGGLRPPFAP